MNITIRLGAPEDAAMLAVLAARTFRDTFAADTAPEDMARHLAQAYGPLQQGRELADPGIVTLLADVGDQCAGYAQLRHGPVPACVEGGAPMELWRFYVDREWHGRGIARTLMTRVDEEARRAGARTLWLGVWERNERAKAFYRKCGFVDVGAHVFMVGSDAQTDRILVRPIEVARVLRFPGGVRRDPGIETWMDAQPAPLSTLARRWFEVMRACGGDVRELLHDGHPTACVGDAAFGYVNAFTDHVNVGFFRGAELPDPDGLLEGTGRFMRHVKLRPGTDVDSIALRNLITEAYADMKRRSQ